MNRNDFYQCLDISLPPGGQIQKSIQLKCCTLIDFMICHKFAIHYACKLWTGMIFRFFPIFSHLLPPRGQIHKSILLKCGTLIHFMICYKIAIHCVCSPKLSTGKIIFLPIFRLVAAPWWPNTEINMTAMLYPDRFHDWPQVCNSLSM